MGQPQSPGVNIDPYASVPYGQVGEPSVNNQGGTQGGGQAQVSNPQRTGTEQSQVQAQQAGQTAPSLGQPGTNGMYTVDQATATAAAEVQAANVNVAAMWEQVRATQAKIDEIQRSNDPVAIQQQLPSLTNTLNATYTSLSQAEQRVETANAAYSTSLQNAIKTNVVTPSEVQLAQSQATKADADAATAKAQAQVLTDGAPGQRALVAAQAGQASAAAAASQAQADATRAKTPAEAAQLNAQAAALNAQATQTNTLLPGLVEKQKAEIGLTQAQTDLTGSQSNLAQAQAGQASANTGLINAQADYQRGLVTAGGPQATVAGQQAQAGLAGAQATGQLAGAAGTLAGIQQNQLGPLYGLQDRVNAIRAIQQQVFGPGGSGDPSEANDLLNQFVTSSIAGTTPYAANIAAANAGLTAFGTQASMYNAAQQALASRANALAGLGGSVLGTLGQMNANAPAGSTALAGAFRDVMNFAGAQQQQAQDAFARQMGLSQTPGGGLQQPTAPPLPALLQRLTASPTASAGAPPPQTSAPVTINIGGAGPGPAPAPAPALPTTPAPPPGGYAANQPGTYGALSASMPALLQKNMPLSPQQATDYWHQINGVQPPGQAA